MTTTPPSKTKALPIVLGIIALLVVVGLFNMDDDEPTSTSSSLSTSTEVLAPQPEATPPAETPPAAQAAAPEADTSVAAVVPDVIGMNHQLAQDTLQAAGFYLLLEEDATGQGRSLLWDRNWEVVSQSVPGGTTTSIATPVTLFAKKIGE